MYQPLNGWTKASMIEAIQTRNKGTKSWGVWDKSKPADYPRNKGCLYRTDDGNHCAVGCFIPEGHKSFENFKGATWALLKNYPDLAIKLPLPVVGLSDLQAIHDSFDTEKSKDPRPALIAWINENVEDNQPIKENPCNSLPT